jgi:hypothetical protein
MKRGLIAWDKSELPPEIFERRMNRVRRVLAERDIPALAVYSDLWRSNQARFFSNYMPYFNRALLIISRDAPPALLCGLSPRVYGWIRSVTIIEDVRPAGNFVKPLLELAGERRWTQIGVLDLEQLPYDICQALRASPLGLLGVDSGAVFSPSDDDAELTMRRKAAALARQILEEELPHGPGLVDHHFVGILERRFRRAGAEDLVILLTNGRTAPAPPFGAVLEDNFSISVAMEYRGHWVRISRPHGLVKPPSPHPALGASYSRWEKEAASPGGEFLDGAYPYEWGSGKIMALSFEYNHNGKRLFYGDTIL